MEVLTKKLTLVFAGLFSLYLVLGLYFGTFSFLATVTSNSMSPTLERGDFVLLQKASFYAVGDILVFSAGTSVFVHRAVKVEEGGFRTKGDANPFDDGRVVAPEDIFGKVAFRIPLLGHVALWLSGE